MNNRIYYRYVRKEDRTPIGCAAIEVNSEEKRLHVGWSFCCDLDNFNKKIARSIAGGRAKSHKCSAIFPEPRNERAKKFYDGLKFYVDTFMGRYPEYDITVYGARNASTK